MKRLFKDMHEDWIPYKKREEEAINLFEKALELLKENEGNYFGLIGGDIEIVSLTEDGSNPSLRFEDERTGRIVVALGELLYKIHMMQGRSYNPRYLQGSANK